MNHEIRNPVQVVFRNMQPSPAIEENVHTHTTKLTQYFDRIMSCRVVIEPDHRHHHKGNLYHVRIDLKVPDAELVASRDPAEDHAHEDVYVAIRDAFEAIKRQLKEYASKRRGDVKHHETALHGFVTEVAPLADYGYIETADNRKVRFTSNSVVNYDFNRLEIGDKVRFVETEHHDEPAASTVYIETKNNKNKDSDSMEF